MFRRFFPTQTSGAKAFSSQAGISLESEGTISDAGAVYEIQKKHKALFPLLQKVSVFAAGKPSSLTQAIYNAYFLWIW